MKKISKYLLFVSLVTLFTILVVVTQRSYDRIVQTKAKVSGDFIVRPISTDIDVSIIDTISSRTEYPVNYDLILPTPTSTPAPTLIPTQ